MSIISILALVLLFLPLALVAVIIVLAVNESKNKRMIDELHKCRRISDFEYATKNVHYSVPPSPVPYNPPMPQSGAPSPAPYNPPMPQSGAPSPAPYNPPMPQSEAPSPAPYNPPMPQSVAPSPAPYNPPMPQSGAPSPTPYNPPVPQSMYYIPCPPRPQKKDSVSSISVILVIGVVFLILAGFVFAKTTWVLLSDPARIATLASFSAVFFGFGALAGRKFKLGRTEIALFTIGSAFLPISVASSGYIGLFGSYLSPDGGGSNLLYALSFTALAVPCVIGGMNFKSKAFSVVSMASLTLTMAFLADYLFGYQACCLFLSVLLLALLVLSNISFSKENSFTQMLIPFSVFCAIIFPFANITKTNVLSSIAAFLFAMAFFMPSIQKATKGFASVPASLLLIIWVFRTINFAGAHIVSGFAVCTLIFILLGFAADTGKGPKMLFSAIGCAGILLTSAVYAFNIGRMVSPNGADCIDFVNGALVFAAALLLGLKKENSLLLRFAPVSAVVLIFQSVFLALGENIGSYALIAGLCVLGYIIFASIKKIRTSSSDLAFPFGVFVASLALNNKIFTNIHISRATAFFAMLALFVMLLCNAAGKKRRDVSSVFSSAVIPLSVLYIVEVVKNASLSIRTDISRDNDIFAIILFFTCSTLVVFFCGRKQNSWPDKIAFYSNYAVVIICSIFPVWNSAAEFAAVLFAAFVTLYISFHEFTQKNKELCYLSFFTSGILMLRSQWAFFTSVIYDGSGPKASICAWTCAAVALFIYSVIFAVNRKAIKEGMMMDALGLFVSIALPVFTVLFSIASFRVEFIPICVFVGIALSAYGFFSSKKLLPTVACGLAFVIFVGRLLVVHSHGGASLNYHADMLIDIGVSMVLFYLFGLVGKLARPKISERLSRSMLLLTIAVPVMLLLLLGSFPVKLSAERSDLQLFVAFLLLAQLPLLWVDYDNIVGRDRLLMTLSSAGFAISLWIQPFFDTKNTWLEGKMYLIPFVAVFFVQRYIYPHKKTTTQGLFFASVVWSFLSLSVQALTSNQLRDAFVILVLSFVVLVASFVVKQRRWFILSAATLCLLTAVLTRRFGVSFQWWVYLLAVGVVLIVIAASNEYLKARGDSIKSKAGRFWQEWTW